MAQFLKLIWVWSVKMTGVKTDVLEMFTQGDFIPVIAPLGVDEGEYL